MIVILVLVGVIGVFLVVGLAGAFLAALPASTGDCKRSMWGLAVVFAVVLGVAESAPCP
jgi:hypothetical protein